MAYATEAGTCRPFSYARGMTATTLPAGHSARPAIQDPSARAALEAALAAHPKVTLSHGTTALQPLARLGERLGLRLWAKRDDCNGLALGGNKVRQLEYYLGPTRDNGADTMLITGAVQSNFVRLAAAAARQLGLHPIVQLEHRVPTNRREYLASGNVLINQLLGADIHYFDGGDDEAAADRSLDALGAAAADAGRKPHVIHLGTDHPPLGALGYVRCALELKAQLDEAGESATHLVVGSGSGITHSGLLAGARAIGWNIPVVGICVRRDASLQQPRIARRTREVLELLGLDVALTDDDIIVRDQVLAPGYGQLNDRVRDAVRDAAHTEGLLLDPVYTGRAMAGLIEAREAGVFGDDANVVFIHTGGTPGIFAYGEVLVGE